MRGLLGQRLAEQAAGREPLLSSNAWWRESGRGQPLNRRWPYASGVRIVEAREEEGQVRSGTQQQKRQQIGRSLPALLLGELTSEWQAY